VLEAGQSRLANRLGCHGLNKDAAGQWRERSPTTRPTLQTSKLHSRAWLWAPF
jgi:hypothetical protein